MGEEKRKINTNTAQNKANIQQHKPKKEKIPSQKQYKQHNTNAYTRHAQKIEREVEVKL